MGVNLERDLLDRINRDPAEEKKRSLYISPLNKALKDTELTLTMADVEAGLIQVLTNNLEMLESLDVEKTQVRNFKGYARVTFPDMEFLLMTNNFFTNDRRIFVVNDIAFQFITPKDTQDNTELYFGGWKQHSLTPKEIIEFLSQIPHFPCIISVASPKDKRTGRFNPFFCFVTVKTVDAQKILNMKIRSAGNLLKIALAKKKE